MQIYTTSELLSYCLRLIPNHDVLSVRERDYVASVACEVMGEAIVSKLKEAIVRGEDPLGSAFLAIKSAADRRGAGAIYTPRPIVASMVRWLQGAVTPNRVVDAGAGSGRYIIEAARMFPQAALVAVEMDPLAALMLRANLAVTGYDARTTVIVDDYRNVDLPEINGITAYVGNPPYVRHHDIEPGWKKWYSRQFERFGVRASALGGLHLHFFLKTRLLSKEGDYGVFITSAEWLDVNYGAALRHLLVEELGCIALHVLEPEVQAFPGTAVTAAITCFQVGQTQEHLRVRLVSALSELNGLSAGTDVGRERFQKETKWSLLIRPQQRHDEGEIELGELFRVHRGQVTGANNVWIAGKHSNFLPESVLIPSVTKAVDLLMAGESLETAERLRRVVDIPTDLDAFTADERKGVDRFLDWARYEGADQSYTAQHRKTWWSVGLKAPAPILCTYMGRRPPHFTVNNCGARHINIAHGLYPVEPIDPILFSRLTSWLNSNVSRAGGRTYSGGLTKFEPKELERVKIPRLENLGQ